jgi:hypothetical protein
MMKIQNYTPAEEIMKIIGGWFYTDGSLIELYGMFDSNTCGTLF